MWILGISAFYHDSAAALIKDGKIIAAAQEERFSRLKHDARFPEQAIAYCLQEGGIHLEDVANVVFFEKPFLKFERLLETYVQFAPRGFSSFRRAMPLWIKEKLFQKSELLKALKPFARSADHRPNLLFSEHHMSHAASAFYASPFTEAAVLTMDGVGEWASGTLAIGQGADLRIIQEMHFPHSLGLLYSAFTYYCGFRVNSGEYKLMGLAPYGQPRYADVIRENLIDIKADGSFRLDLKYFDYCTGLTMTNKRFHRLFGAPPRSPETALTQLHMDLAASVQRVTEEVVLKLARHVYETTQLPNLCLAGGVALNCVANGKLRNSGIFENIWVQPAAGDAGGALGAAYVAHYLYHKQTRQPERPDAMQGAYLGNGFTQSDIEHRLHEAGAVFESLSDDALYTRVVALLAEQKVVGWFQGRMEFGPRALGNRSIIGDPRSAEMQRTMNLKIKYRESFRPFAPAVLADQVSDYFNYTGRSDYMLMVDQLHASRYRPIQSGIQGLEKLQQVDSDLPAITHVDGSARIQTVHEQTNPRFHALLSAWYEQTGCPVLINTSFNVRGEPIVATPQDAFRCFMGTQMDVLVIGNCVLEKTQQDPALQRDYKDRFALD